MSDHPNVPRPAWNLGMITISQICDRARGAAMGSKQALDTLLRGEGSSLSEWVDEQLDVRSPQTQGPAYPEISDTAALRDREAVAQDLTAIDWSFSQADTLYLSHDVHPYPAKFIPQIAGHLIAKLSVRGEVVLDPFGGSGTTALEAVRLGRRAISVDANPLGGLIGRVKTARLDESAQNELRALAASLRARLSDWPDSPDIWLEEFSAYVPPIPNLDKWFAPWSQVELALIRCAIKRLIDPVATDVASLALSRTVLKASYQESETRYVAAQREIDPRSSVTRFLRELALVLGRVERTADEVQYGIANFVTADARNLNEEDIADDSVDLVVTSPPYGNANDYHLYHRFRLFWLGHDPGNLGSIEIGSHLRHQREGTGFDDYMSDMALCLDNLGRILKPGRYAAFVIGDAVYEGETFDAAAELSSISRRSGFETVVTLDRPIHETKRSFRAGRRAINEKILILRSSPSKVRLFMQAPAYRMWPYEEVLRQREIETLLTKPQKRARGELSVTCDPYEASKTRRLVFSRRISSGTHAEATWQEVLENGLAADPATRKDPKYVTHGLHAYKGKFYPQLAKALINLSGIAEGATVLDPFCGSGTTLLEARLNGLRARGTDLHPLAAKIAKAKIGILDVSPTVVRDVFSAMCSRIESASTEFPHNRDQFQSNAIEEIEHWFPPAVIDKMNWLLANARSLTFGVLQDFLEVLLSDLLRSVSQQDPGDLRIRRRKVPIEDADLVGMYLQSLRLHLGRLEKFWRVRGYSPYAFHPAEVAEGDARQIATFRSLGLSKGSVDLVLTSPPYATALPYIDTDRLSLLVLFGATSSERRPLEQKMTGSREISLAQRRLLDEQIGNGTGSTLPKELVNFVARLQRDNARSGAGFRRMNLPSLLVRFFDDMARVLAGLHDVMKSGSELMMVLGDNTTNVEGRVREIPTTAFVAEIGCAQGFLLEEKMPITVTRENVVHARHAITKNTVLRMRRA